MLLTTLRTSCSRCFSKAALSALIVFGDCCCCWNVVGCGSFVLGVDEDDDGDEGVW